MSDQVITVRCGNFFWYAKRPHLSIKLTAHGCAARLVKRTARPGETVVVRVTVSAPEMRPQHVTVRFTVASDVAKVLAEQLLMAARMAETHKQL